MNVSLQKIFAVFRSLRLSYYQTINYEIEGGKSMKVLKIITSDNRPFPSASTIEKTEFPKTAATFVILQCPDRASEESMHQ